MTSAILLQLEFETFLLLFVSLLLIFGDTFFLLALETPLIINLNFLTDFPLGPLLNDLGSNFVINFQVFLFFELFFHKINNVVGELFDLFHLLVLRICIGSINQLENGFNYARKLVRILQMD